MMALRVGASVATPRQVPSLGCMAFSWGNSRSAFADAAGGVRAHGRPRR